MIHLFLICLMWSFIIIVVGKLVGTLIIAFAMKRSSKYKRFTLLQLMFINTEFLSTKLYDRIVFNGDLKRSCDFKSSILTRVKKLTIKDPGLVIGGRQGRMTIRKLDTYYYVIYQPKGKPLKLKPMSLEELDKVIETFSNIEYNLNFDNDIKIHL